MDKLTSPECYAYRLKVEGATPAREVYPFLKGLARPPYPYIPALVGKLSAIPRGHAALRPSLGEAS